MIAPRSISGTLRYFMLFAADSTFWVRSLLLHDLSGDKLHFRAQNPERLVDVTQGVLEVGFTLQGYLQAKIICNGDHPLQQKTFRILCLRIFEACDII